MKTNNLLACAAMTASLVFYACGSGKSATAKTETKIQCNTTPVYSADIKPLIDKYCALSCHSAKSSAAGIVLDTYELLAAEAVKPRFMGALRHKLPYAPMPKKNPKFSDSTLKVLDCWIAGGMQR